MDESPTAVNGVDLSCRDVLTSIHGESDSLVVHTDTTVTKAFDKDASYSAEARRKGFWSDGEVEERLVQDYWASRLVPAAPRGGARRQATLKVEECDGTTVAWRDVAEHWEPQDVWRKLEILGVSGSVTFLHVPSNREAQRVLFQEYRNFGEAIIHFSSAAAAVAFAHLVEKQGYVSASPSTARPVLELHQTQGVRAQLARLFGMHEVAYVVLDGELFSIDTQLLGMRVQKLLSKRETATSPPQ